MFLVVKEYGWGNDGKSLANFGEILSFALNYLYFAPILTILAIDVELIFT